MEPGAPGPTNLTSEPESQGAGQGLPLRPQTTYWLTVVGSPVASDWAAVLSPSPEWEHTLLHFSA